VFAETCDRLGLTSFVVGNYISQVSRAIVDVTVWLICCNIEIHTDFRLFSFFHAPRPFAGKRTVSLNLNYYFAPFYQLDLEHYCFKWPTVSDLLVQNSLRVRALITSFANFLACVFALYVLVQVECRCQSLFAHRSRNWNCKPGVCAL
jgi:hypothetical protein